MELPNNFVTASRARGLRLVGEPLQLREEELPANGEPESFAEVGIVREVSLEVRGKFSD
jgi:hypothetical protein